MKSIRCYDKTKTIDHVLACLLYHAWCNTFWDHHFYFKKRIKFNSGVWWHYTFFTCCFKPPLCKPLVGVEKKAKNKNKMRISRQKESFLGQSDWDVDCFALGEQTGRPSSTQVNWGSGVCACTLHLDDHLGDQVFWAAWRTTWRQWTSHHTNIQDKGFKVHSCKIPPPPVFPSNNQCQFCQIWVHINPLSPRSDARFELLPCDWSTRYLCSQEVENYTW